MKYARLTILACLLASVARAQFCALPITQVSGALDIQFISTGHSNGWTAPFITSTLLDSQVTWIAPSGVSTNSKTPALSFFFEAGTYSIRATDWSKVTRLSFYAGVDNATRNFLSAIPNSKNTLAQLTGLTDASSMFRHQTRNFASMANIPLDKWTLCKTMSYAFSGCSGLTGSISDLSKMTLCKTMYSAFFGCSGLTGSPPDLSKMTLCESMYATFFGCSGLTGSPPDLSKMILCKTMDYTFYECSGLTGSPPDLSKMTLCESMYATFYVCYGLTGSPPDLSKMTLCKTMVLAFYGCSGLNGNGDVFTGDMTNLTTSANCFYNNTSLTGAGSNFINIAKSPSYTVGTASTNSSYRTFYGCTNLTDWATIPAAYK